MILSLRTSKNNPPSKEFNRYVFFCSTLFEWKQSIRAVGETDHNSAITKGRRVVKHSMSYQISGRSWGLGNLEGFRQCC